MFDNEIAISRFLVCCNAIVFITETAFANRIRPYVSQETMYLTLLYYLIATCASARDLTESSRSVWACVTWVCLCSIPLATLLSFLYNFRHSIVDCLSYDSARDAQFCHFGGDRSLCESFVIAAKTQTVQEGCANFVLGTFMGSLYAIMVFIFRFTTCLFGGVYFAFTFNKDRLYVSGMTSRINHDQDRPPSLPSTAFYLGWSLFLWGVFALEFAAGKHHELSSCTTLLVFAIIVLIQIRRMRYEFKSEEHRILQHLQFVGSIVLVFFTYADFIRNAIGFASICAELIDHRVLSMCQEGDKVCLDTRNALSISFFRQHNCPQLSLDPTRNVYFYLGQALRLIFLAIVYPVALIYKNIRPDERGFGMQRKSHLKENIDTTPVHKVDQLLRATANLTIQRQHDEQRRDTVTRAPVDH